MIHTYNEYHLGDQLIHLNFLRKACKINPGLEVTHHCNPQYHKQLKPLLEDMPIYLEGLVTPPNAIHAWIGHANFFYEHPHRRNWALFHLAWFDRLSSIMEISNPMACKEDFLFDYPELRRFEPSSFDYLIINSPPQSGQLPDYNPDFFKKRVQNLCNEGYKVITTYPTGITYCTLDDHLTVTDIGILSRFCKHIEGVDTGPMWTTHNIFNQNSVLSRTIYTNASDVIDISTNTVILGKM